MSKRHPLVPPALHGTYAGLAHPAMIEHFLTLGRHEHRAAAGARVRDRAAASAARAHELLGLQLPQLLHSARRVRHRGEPPTGSRSDPARVQGHGEAPARGRTRGHPRRRLQPHRRGGHRRSAHEPARHRQPLVLPPAGRRRLHRRHRVRQLGQHVDGCRGPTRARLAALLGERRADRRLPVRSRRHARTRRLPPLHPRSSAAAGDRRRPGARGGQEDRRAVGRRHGRLADRQLRRRLARVERPLPRPRPQLLAERRRLRPAGVDLARRHRRLRHAPVGVVEHVQRRARTARERELRHRARRLHAARPRLVRRQAQRRQRRAEPRRRRHEPLVQPRRRRPDVRRGHPRDASQGDAQPPGHAAAVGRRADDHGGRRVRPHPARQQQRVLPRLAR